ncbi:hypothetical protein OsI_28902 [Oryza sativa Indica Group]|uniref:Uncharacterized protein n=1 Tax=Oryza sativa subsp. indica TaxID=39946 RepID=B8B9Z3_ORYSI|nr:hypothetical protein OsI_28902 [Oryza sativa Indica Group]
MNVLASKIFPSRSNVASEQQQSKREKATIDDAKNSSKNKNLDRSVDENMSPAKANILMPTKMAHVPSIIQGAR